MTAVNKLPIPEMVSEEMRAVMEKSAALAPDANDTSMDLAAMRAAYQRERHYWNQGGPVMRQTSDVVVTTPAGDVPLRFYYPETQVTLPAIIYIHGGGFVVGSPQTHDRIMRTLAWRAQAVVVGVDYALSPEAKFPLALHQCAAVAWYLHFHADRYGIDGQRLGLAGDSVGANLSLGAYLHLRDEVDGASYVRALVLYYGLYGLRDSASRRLMGGAWDGLTEADIQYYMDSYLAHPGDARSPYVDPLSADLSQMPPTFIAGAQFDPLIDDSAALAAILRRHDINHQYVVYDGVIHSFLHNSRHLTQAMEALKNGADFFTRATQTITTPPHHK